MDEIICGTDRKLSIFYNIIMELKLEKEEVKEVIIKWAKKYLGTNNA